MATPRENPSDLSARQSAELIRDQLDTKHSQSYMLFSLDPTTREHLPYRKEIFHNRVRLKNFTRETRNKIFNQTNLGHWITLSRWKTFSTFNWFTLSLSEDQFISPGISIKYRCTSLFGRILPLHWYFNRELIIVGWKKSSGIWCMCIDCLSWYF